jgi:hypothetical protein
MAKINLCIVLILIVLIIYLLETSSHSEALTVNHPTPESLISSFNNNVGLSVAGNVSGGNTGINPISANTSNDVPGSDYTLASSFGMTTNNPNEMTKVGAHSVDPNIINYYSKQMASDMEQKPFSAKEFLPKEINENWFETNLNNAQNELEQDKLIEVNRFCYGIDSVGSSLKNASRDIRGSGTSNPKLVVSPWMNSSYEPDLNIKSWC